MLRIFILFILISCPSIQGFATDFDAIVVGTSPISLLEALYRHHTGERVLILEESATYGGAWKSIDICGISCAELGCHLIGNNKIVSTFLEKYVGCEIVSMDNPHTLYDSKKGGNGFYLKEGCREMMCRLIELIEATDILVLLNHELESVTLDDEQLVAIAHTKDGEFSTSKIVVTPYSHIKIKNHPTTSLSAQPITKTKHYHLYVLIEDATPPRFTYRGGVGGNSTRTMNLTSFIGLEGTNTQLIVFQVQNVNCFASAQAYLNALKKLNLVDDSACILTTDTYIYEQSQYNQSLIKQLPNGHLFFEILQTHHLLDMSKYIPKWEKVLPLIENSDCSFCRREKINI